MNPLTPLPPCVKPDPRFGLIIVGDEILSGKRTDKHLPKVIELLKARGLQLDYADYVGDAPERITATLWVCRACHNQIHRLFSEKELALTYNNREALLADERLRTFVAWLASKPAGFTPRF